MTKHYHLFLGQMTMITFDEIDQLAEQSLIPLPYKLMLERMQYFVIKHNHEAPQKRESYYRFLYLLARRLKPRLSIELGVWNGLGSHHMCMGHQSGVVVGVDHNNPKFDFVFTNSNFHFLHMDTAAMGDEIKAMHDVFGPIDLVFQDSSHHYEPSCIE